MNFTLRVWRQVASELDGKFEMMLAAIFLTMPVPRTPVVQAHVASS